MGTPMITNEREGRMKITIEISLDDAKLVFNFLAKNVGSTFGVELMPVINIMDALSKAARAAGEPFR